MLQLILGVPGSGKTHEIRERIGRTVEEGRLRVMLLVPEQYSFENERALYDRLGPSGAIRAEVLSFTRLCELIFRTCGGLAGGRLSDAGRTLLVSQALLSCKTPSSCTNVRRGIRPLPRSLRPPSPSLRRRG